MQYCIHIQWNLSWETIPFANKMWFLKRCAILYSGICLESPPLMATKFDVKNPTKFYVYT